MDKIEFDNYLIYNYNGTEVRADHNISASLDKMGESIVIDGVTLSPEGEHGVRMRTGSGSGAVIWPNGTLRAIDIADRKATI